MTNFHQTGSYDKLILKTILNDFLNDFLFICCHFRDELVGLYRDLSMLSWEDKKYRGIQDIISKFKEIPRSVR